MSEKYITDVGAFNRHFLNELRGASILRVMMVHLGLSWFYMPYSSYIGALLPLLFFISGAVSLFSFRRSKKSVSVFTYNRLVSILAPYFLLVFIIYVASFVIDGWHVENMHFWLLVAPDTSSLPFALGQVWFLQALSLITLITLPIFMLSINYQFTLVLYAAFALLLIAVNSYFPIHQYFVLFEKIDFYLALSNSFFFIIGGLYFIYESRVNGKLLFWACASALVLGCYINFSFYDGSLGVHMASPSLVYVLCSVSIILMIFTCKFQVQRFISNVKWLEWIFMYCSKHAYSLYLLHTLVIFAVEKYIYPTPLTGDFFHAILKMLLVIVISLLISPAYSQLSNILIKKVKQ